jgi:Serine protease inhibitor
VDAINGWVSNATAKKIPTIIDSIDPSEVMFLINAIYFKGAWQQKFDKAQTANAPFRSSAVQSQSVPMMHREGKVRYAREPGLTAVDLYYGNSAFAMTLLLPDSTSDIDASTEALTPAAWNRLLGEFGVREVNLFLPRFRIEWNRKLNDDLTAMGLGVAFTDNADFTGMSDQGRRLRISRVIQKTYVDVNEEGTEAAAVTSVGIQLTSIELPTTVRFDRPFIFAIRERFSGTILFIGKIAKLPA